MYIFNYRYRMSFVGRTHIIVRLQTGTRRKDGTENFGGFIYVLDGFLQRDFVLWGFMCSINFSLFSCVSFPATTPRAPRVSLFRLPCRGLPRPIYTARAITPPGRHTYQPTPHYCALLSSSVFGRLCSRLIAKTMTSHACTKCLYCGAQITSGRTRVTASQLQYLRFRSCRNFSWPV